MFIMNGQLVMADKSCLSISSSFIHFVDKLLSFFCSPVGEILSLGLGNI